jgi:hypothetical protein
MTHRYEDQQKDDSMRTNPYLTPQQAAAQHGISVGAISEAVAIGALRSYIHPETGEALLQAGDVAGWAGGGAVEALDTPVGAAAVAGAGLIAEGKVAQGIAEGLARGGGARAVARKL